MTSPRVWFITGSNSGFGRIMTEIALIKGDKVIATARRPETLKDLESRYPSSKLAVLKVDVTNKNDIIAAFDKAKELFGRIDIVFNNAGQSCNAEVEGTDEDIAKRMFEVNFWGAGNVSREAVRFFREVNSPGQGGFLLFVSSECGIQGYPTNGYYCASKFACEGLHDTLSKEIDPDWNIKITIIEPGYFATEVMQNIERNGATMSPHPAYSKPTLAGNVLRKWQATPGNDPADATQAVEKMYELSLLENPPLRFPLGADTLDAFKDKAKEYSEAVENYASWSADFKQITIEMK